MMYKMLKGMLYDIVLLIVIGGILFDDVSFFFM